MTARNSPRDAPPVGEEARAYVAAILRSRRFRRRAGLGLWALALGVVAGMAVFVFINEGLMPGYAEDWWALGIVLATGALVPLVVPGLRSSVAVLIWAFFVGLAVHVTAWTLPLWLLEFPVRARDVLLPGYVGRALLSAVLVYPTTLVVGYLLGLVADVVFHT